MWSLLFTGESAGAQMSLTGVQKQCPERKERLGPKGAPQLLGHRRNQEKTNGSCEYRGTANNSNSAALCFSRCCLRDLDGVLIVRDELSNVYE